jgi:hypothetical protein
MHAKISMSGRIYRRPKLEGQKEVQSLPADFFLPLCSTFWKRCLDHNSSRSFDYAGNRDFDFRN